LKIKTLAVVSVFLFTLVIFASCADIDDLMASSHDFPRICLVLGPGGVGDRGFNDAAVLGLLRAEMDFGISYELLMPAADDDVFSILYPIVESEEFDLIIVMGAGVSAEALEKIAPLFPEQKFSHVDSALELANVSGAQTNWVEQTFIAGVTAGLGTLSNMPLVNRDYNKVGVIAGVDTLPMRQGILGFEAGARLVNPDVEVLVGFIGSFNDSGIAYEIAMDMYTQGVDFIQSIGGGAGLGIHEASRDAGRYSFASGANINFIEPEHIVGVSSRDVSDMVYNEISKFMNGTWTAGLHVSGIADGVLLHDTFQSEVVVPYEIQEVVLKKICQIKCGELILPSFASELEYWLNSKK